MANSLRVSEGLAHLDLDTLAWQATNPPTRKPLNESGRLIRRFIDSNEGWVIEGCYTDLLEQALPFANDMIFLNVPIETSISNAKKRPWEPHKYESKEAQDANLEFLMDWISQYSQRSDTFSEQAHQALFDSFDGKKVMFTSNERGDL